jgi:hypothetical protein
MRPAPPSWTAQKSSSVSVRVGSTTAIVAASKVVSSMAPHPGQPGRGAGAQVTSATSSGRPPAACTEQSRAYDWPP